ncbi:MAG TPA: hypothetical protein VHW09_07565 [Bryobacteraceae bacterium]|jgi:hypothetical protein|nr:hypothetical protein [Bryobacteraceae bacterium]
MIASILIIAFSLVLFIYWFRYSCLLLLRSSSEQPAAAAERYHFITVRQNLPGAVALDPLRQSLDRDYRLLTYLLDHAAGLELEKLEYRLLVLDYRMMQIWYRLTKHAAPRQARSALSEMADVLNVLVGRIGEHVGVHTEV